MPGALLMTLFKIFKAVFPFLRELFLSDPRGVSKNARKNNPRRVLLKKFLIATGLGATLLCFYLSYQLWTVSFKYHKLSTQTTECKNDDNTKVSQEAEPDMKITSAASAASADPQPRIRRSKNTVPKEGGDGQVEILKSIQRGDL